jgi:hypothetical protein
MKISQPWDKRSVKLPSSGVAYDISGLTPTSLAPVSLALIGSHWLSLTVPVFSGYC